MTATSIDVILDKATVECAGVGLCTGDYAALNPGFPTITATYHDFTFDPLPSGGYVPLWSFSYLGVSYSLDLMQITAITRGDTGILISGVGLAHIDGLDPTAAAWSFSADKSGTYVAAFSSTATVPDGGSTLALLGTALLTLGLVARRRYSRH